MGRSSSCAGRAASTSPRTRTAARAAARARRRPVLGPPARSAGLALPTRSVHALPAHAAAARRASLRRSTPAVGARHVRRSPPRWSCVTLAAGGLLAWLAGQPTASCCTSPTAPPTWLDDITVIGHRSASVVGLVVGLVAMVGVVRPSRGRACGDAHRRADRRHRFARLSLRSEPLARQRGRRGASSAASTPADVRRRPRRRPRLSGRANRSR